MPKFVRISYCSGGVCIGKVMEEMKPENCTLVEWVKRCQKHSTDPNPIRVLLNEYMELVSEEELKNNE